METLNFDGLLMKLTECIDVRCFGELQTIQEKLSFCWRETKDLQNTDLVDIKLELTKFVKKICKKEGINRKCEAKSKSCKHLGGKAFGRKQDRDALRYYNEGLRFGLSSSETLALLYGNRSAVLFEMRKYQDCLNDISRALQHGFPCHLQYKLMLRQVRCHICLGDSTNADECMRSLSNLIPNLQSDDQEKVLESLDKMENDIDCRNPNDKKPQAEEPNILHKPSNQMPCMSSALKLGTNQEEGRHVITNQDVSRGETLFIEKPFASVLLPQMYASHCQNCITQIDVPIPCDSCPDVVWCSEKCREEGRRFHAYECGYLSVLSGVGIAHLALRVVLEASLTTCLDVSDSSLGSDVTELNSFQSTNKATNYKSVYSLLSHFYDALPEDQFQYCLIALILTLFLKNRIEEMSIENFILDDNEIFFKIAAVLTHHTSQLVCNAHAIVQLHTKESNMFLEDISQERVASAIYPCVSLLNHSCVPSVIAFFEGNTIIVRSVQNLKTGQQVYNCYGTRATSMVRSERQEILSRQYFFECRCCACSSPSAALAEKYWSALVCPSCKQGAACWVDNILGCLNCKRVFEKSHFDLVSRCDKIDALYEQGLKCDDPFEAQDLIGQAASLLHNTYAPDNILCNEIINTFAKLLVKCGKFNEAFKRIKQTHPALEKRYGIDSIEVGHELLKLKSVAQALANDNQRPAETACLDDRIKEIFYAHYGSKWRKYTHL